MARRRMISQELIYDENFNSISIKAQNIFVRMLVVSDDFGVVPANDYTLRAILNPPEKLSKKLQEILKEIVVAKLGITFNYADKFWFMFKPQSFETINSYVLNKRTKSEYLKLDKDEILSEKFQEILRNSTVFSSEHIESIKIKAESRKNKEYTNTFLRFWESYPRKEGKGKAFIEFDKLKVSETLLAEMIAAIEIQKKSDQWKKDKGQYIPHPSTWLYQKRWEDQPLSLVETDKRRFKGSDVMNQVFGDKNGH